MFVYYLLFVFNNIAAELMDIKKWFISSIKNKFPIGWNIKEGVQEGTSLEKRISKNLYSMFYLWKEETRRQIQQHTA